jgi:hypothetical protein
MRLDRFDKVELGDFGVALGFGGHCPTLGSASAQKQKLAQNAGATDGARTRDNQDHKRAKTEQNQIAVSTFGPVGFH